MLSPSLGHIYIPQPSPCHPVPSKLVPLSEEALGFLFAQFLLTLGFLGPFHV